MNNRILPPWVLRPGLATLVGLIVRLRRLAGDSAATRSTVVEEALERALGGPAQ